MDGRVLWGTCKIPVESPLINSRGKTSTRAFILTLMFLDNLRPVARCFWLPHFHPRHFHRNVSKPDSQLSLRQSGCSNLWRVVRELDPYILKENLYPVKEGAFKALDDTARHVIRGRKRITLRSPHYRTSPMRTIYPKNFKEVVVRSDNPNARITPIPRQSKQLGWFPGMPFPCQSPFKLARILSNGDVQLCYKFVVGNLHSDSFENIWFGQKANSVRRCLMGDDTTCKTCDYYRFCLKYNAMDLEDRKTFFTESLVHYAHVVSFEHGTVNAKVTPLSPRLVETFGSYNIVSYNRKYLGIPRSVGHLT